MNERDTNKMKNDLNQVKHLVQKGLEGHGVKVILFGSHATGKAGRTSDIDVAVLPLEPLPREVLSEIRYDLQESNVLYHVDLVDLTESGNIFAMLI